MEGDGVCGVGCGGHLRALEGGEQHRGQRPRLLLTTRRVVSAGTFLQL
jgi:hypothetical protein